MYYREFRPPPLLAPYVKCFWLLDRDYHGSAETVWPDGRTELIFHYGDRYSLGGGTGPVVPNGFVIGPLTRFVHLTSSGRVRLAGARFHAWGMASLCKVPAEEMRDLVLPSADLLGRRASEYTERLADATSSQSVRLLEELLLGRLSGAARPDRIVTTLAGRLLRDRIRIADAARDAGLSTRQLQRRFKAAIGVGPRFFSVVERFNAARKELAADPESDLTEVAFRLGYSDAAHFCRDFRRFYNMSPTAFSRWVASTRAVPRDVAFVQEAATRFP